MSEWDDSDESSKQSVIAMGSTYTIPDITNGENLLGQTYTISGGALGNQSPISLGSDTRDTLTPVPVSPFPDNGSGTNTDTTSIKVRKDLAWWGCFSIANPSETSLKLKSHKDLLANDQLRNCQEFCTEHGSDTAMLCGKFQNNWTIMMNVIKQCDFGDIWVQGAFRTDFLYLISSQLQGFHLMTQQNDSTSTPPFSLSTLSLHIYLAHYVIMNCCNSLAPVKFEWNFRYVNFKRILVIDGWGISYEIALIWMSLNLTDDQSTFVQVMAWCCQATSHYPSQCWPKCLSPYGVTRPQWV